MLLSSRIVKIDIWIMLICIIIGIGIMYIIAPKPEIIIKMPNEKNVYIDTNNVCYKYKKSLVPMPVECENI